MLGKEYPKVAVLRLRSAKAALLLRMTTLEGLAAQLKVRPFSFLAGVMCVMVMSGMMMAGMVVMMMAAGECGDRHHDQGDEQEWQKLFHARIIASALHRNLASKVKRTILSNPVLRQACGSRLQPRHLRSL